VQSPSGHDNKRKEEMTLTIAKKVYAILGGILAIFLVMFGLLLAASHEQTTDFADRYGRDVEAAVQLSRAQDSLWRLRYGFPQFLAYAENSPERQKIVDDEAGLYAGIGEALDKFEKTGIDAPQSKALSELRAAYRSTPRRGRAGSSCSRKASPPRPPNGAPRPPPRTAWRPSRASASCWR
jgi:hypothetical protein